MKEEQKNNSNIKMKVLSVVIASLIWLLVANTNDPVISKRFSNVPVKVINAEALTKSGYAYEIIEGQEVSFTIKGKKSIVNNMTADDFSVMADFTKLSLTDAVPIDITTEKYGDQLEINLGNTNTMKIAKDEIIVISLPVNVSISGTASEGYYVGSSTTTPNLVRVTGPRNLLKNAKEIRASVDVEGTSNDITSSVKPLLCDQRGNLIESKQIEMDASNINVFVNLWKTKEVTIRLAYSGKPKSGYALTSFEYEPKTVLVAADQDVYDKLEELNLGYVSVDDKSATYEENIPIDDSSFPDGVILAENINSIKISAKIEKVDSKKITFTKKDLNIKNDEGYKISFESSNEYYVNVTGPESRINTITVEEFQPWIDLSNLDEGEHLVTIHVKENPGLTIDKTSKIRITLEK